MPTTVLTRRGSGVVARGESLRAELADDVVEQRVELHVLVAGDARIRCLAPGVRVHETIDDMLAEHVGVIERIERNAERGRGAARVLPCLVRSAAARRVDVAARRDEAHPHAYDVLPTVGEYRRRDRGIDAAAHRDEHPTHAV